MTKKNFPHIAAALGLILAIIVFKGSVTDDNGKTVLPLLTLLIMCEFGAIVTAIGSYLGGKQILSEGFDLLHVLITIFCIILCVQFFQQGLELWPN